MSLRRRVLDIRERHAREVHYCDYCDGGIFPGDLYQVRVEVITNGPYKALRVLKAHISPACMVDPRDLHESARTNVIPFRKAA